MSQIATDELLYEIRGTAGWVTLNRPEARNALTFDMYEGLAEICGTIPDDGFAVLVYDPLGQGERSQFWDEARGRSRYNLVCGEHAVLGNLATLAGASLARWEVWDGMRALDYLLTRPEVDPFDEVAWEMNEGSICGLGMVASEPLTSAMKHFASAFGRRETP